MLADRLGPWFYRSFVLHRLVTTLDELPLSWLRRARIERIERPAPASTGRDRFAALMEHVRVDLDARECRVLVVFLPQRGEPREQYAWLRDALPPGMPSVDVHEELAASLTADDFIASGHYDADVADRVARRIAIGVDEVLGAAE